MLIRALFPTGVSYHIHIKHFRDSNWQRDILFLSTAPKPPWKRLHWTLEGNNIHRLPDIDLHQFVHNGVYVWLVRSRQLAAEKPSLHFLDSFRNYSYNYFRNCNVGHILQSKLSRWTQLPSDRDTLSRKYAWTPEQQPRWTTSSRLSAIEGTPPGRLTTLIIRR